MTKDIDILGMILEHAEQRLKERALPYEVEEIHPRGREEVTDGILRVIKSDVEPNGAIKITVCKVPDVYLVSQNRLGGDVS